MKPKIVSILLLLIPTLSFGQSYNNTSRKTLPNGYMQTNIGTSPSLPPEQVKVNQMRAGSPVYESSSVFWNSVDADFKYPIKCSWKEKKENNRDKSNIKSTNTEIIFELDFCYPFKISSRDELGSKPFFLNHTKNEIFKVSPGITFHAQSCEVKWQGRQIGVYYAGNCGDTYRDEQGVENLGEKLFGFQILWANLTIDAIDRHIYVE